jgi:two-component sensor histidine kinase
MTSYLVEMKPTPPLEPLRISGPAATAIGEASDATVPPVNNRGTELFHLPCSALEGACSEQHGDKSTVIGNTGESASIMECSPPTAMWSNGEWVATEGRWNPVLRHANSTLEEPGTDVGGGNAWTNSRKPKGSVGQLRRVLEKKDLRMREIIHRNANNYQVLTSLIELHKNDYSNVREFAAYVSRKITQLSRIQSMLHDIFGATRSLGTFIEALCSPYRDDMRKISVLIDENIVFSRDQVQTLGMIINELVCNSIEHAFGDHQPGLIEVEVRLDDGHVQARISDNGKGLDGQTRRSGSFGLQLVERLVAQLDGTSSYAGRIGGGTAFVLRFPLDQTLTTTADLETS